MSPSHRILIIALNQKMFMDGPNKKNVIPPPTVFSPYNVILFYCPGGTRKYPRHSAPSWNLMNFQIR